jgi:Flp pilus assembly protein TadB
LLKFILIIAIVLAFGSLVMYNGKILNALGKSRKRSEGIFYKLLGKHMRRWNTRVERSSNLKKGSLKYKINNYLKDIIVNLGMARDNVTPVGLVTFMASIAFSCAFFYVFWSGETALFIPAFCAIFYFVIVLFRFASLTRYEKKEGEIMDTEDLIAMDVKGGVYNAILRYRRSFHPNIKPYFEEFIDNIQNKGYGFREAMLLLNDRLGGNFTDFTQKAIMYEEKADKDMDDIFSAVIEVNRNKRTLRYENNQKFNKLRLEFLISIGVISLYGLFSVWTDPFLANFFKNSLLGKFLLIADVVTVTAVLAYISSIKSKFL